MIINEDVIALQHTIGARFNKLADELDTLQSSIVNMESQFGQLGMVTRVEELLERTMPKKLGWNIRILPQIESNYVLDITHSLLAKAYNSLPTIKLSRKFTTDFIKAIKQGSCKSVINKLKEELKEKATAVYKRGEDPFEENLYTKNLNYIVVEASTAGGCFHAALPVNALSLVDTEDDQSYVAKETKKDHFILEPTKEYLQKTLLKALNSQGLTEEQKQNYIHIIKNGIYRIIKEHLQENINKSYKILGNRVIISSIYNKEL